MKVIAVMGEKGGIGKTITASTIAFLLGSEKNKRVLLVDGDQQGNSSKLYGCYDPEGIGMSELLESTDGEYCITDVIQHTQYERIDVIAANGYLMATNMKLAQDNENDQINRLKNAIAEVSALYDYCICDCGLLFDMTVLNIMIATDLVIVPVKFGGFENDALQNIYDQINDLRQINPQLRMKVIMTMKQGNKASRDTWEWLTTQSGFEVFDTPIRQSVIVGRATSRFVPVPRYAKNGITSKDYRAVVEELEGMNL